MVSKKFSGVYAAVLAPRDSQDAIDVAELTKLIQFLVSKGVARFALNGATGEFPLTTPSDLQLLLNTVRVASEGRAEILCGIGAPSITLATKFAAIALNGGASGLLLPMPYFFGYQQEDLDAFCRQAAQNTELPILLYNLPQFSTGLEKETVRALITEVPNIIGIKDSGKSLDILRDLTEHRLDTGLDACRFVGNDINLRSALSENVCDGIISGIACVLPELTLALFAQKQRAASGEFDEIWGNLKRLIMQIDGFPAPWGLKWIAEARGLVRATFSQPLAESRLAQGREMQAWFREWLPSAVPRETHRF
jgi:4-hydroxy-tetrahydrodipicolinate synthase